MNALRQAQTWAAPLLAALVIAATANAADWPQWRGPERDGVWRESDLVESMPEGGLKTRWQMPADLGYAGPAVADGRVYLFEYEKRAGEITNNPGSRDELDGVERLRCLDAATGEELWRHEYDRPYNVSYPGGPRCTPTVDGDRVYILGAEGDLRCLRTDDGKLLWSKSFPNDYGAETPLWGHSAHPLVVGDLLYCIVGGEGSVAVAFDKLSGEERWRKLSAYEPGYCPPTLVDGELVVFHPEAVVGLTPATGDHQWSVPIRPNYGMSIAQPIVVGDALFATGYGASVSFRIAGGEPDVLWAGTPKTSVSSANATPIYDGRAIYGVDANDSILVAVDPATGKRLWETKAPTLGEGGRGRHGTVFAVRQGETDRYWLFNETGELILARLTPEAYEEVGRQTILEPTSDSFGRPVVWSHPAFAQGAVFARNDEQVVCVELRAE
ncbi:MAG: PQQ-binding-like beta-propeller repeat protein [Planctomycetota bacterium]